MQAWTSPRQVAQNWLSAFSTACVEREDIPAICELFLPEGWLRDSLVLSWDVRSLEGREKIRGYLEQLRGARFVEGSMRLVRDDERAGVGLEARTFELSREVKGVEAGFVFETDVFFGRGFVRLQLDTSSVRGDETRSEDVSGGNWKALSVYIAAEDIKGYEEAGYELGLYAGHTIAWEEIKAARREAIEADPQVLIIGAGQTGLQVAARFRQMSIRTIVVERNEHVGDNWRKRYPTLSLNTPRTHHTLLYAPYPHTWPIFTPRDKIASWLEFYAESQDLVVWTSTTLLPGPEFDNSTRRWKVKLSRNETIHTLHPKHIVLATGTLGDPFIPTIPTLHLFAGTTLHASTYNGGRAYSEKRILIVGSGTTAADIAQDLHERGKAASVTMLQRHPTLVVSRKLADTEFQAWPEGIPVEVSDFGVAGMPLGLAGRIAKSESERERRARMDGALREGLERRGFRTTDGPGGGGRRELVYERLGGYWIDVGAADLIMRGAILVKSDVEIAKVDENGTTVEFSDKSTLDVDVVIFATGYENIRPSMRKLFGAETIDRTSEVWGLDDDGELRGCYRPSGHPGLWYAAGDFYHSRYMSKQLALLIKSDELGLTKFESPAAAVPVCSSPDSGAST